MRHGRHARLDGRTDLSLSGGLSAYPCRESGRTCLYSAPDAAGGRRGADLGGQRRGAGLYGAPDLRLQCKCGLNRRRDHRSARLEACLDCLGAGDGQEEAGAGRETIDQTSLAGSFDVEISEGAPRCADGVRDGGEGAAVVEADVQPGRRIAGRSFIVEVGVKCAADTSEANSVSRLPALDSPNGQCV